MTRGQINTRNPAEAAAMAKCWLASWMKLNGYMAGRQMGLPSIDSFHPEACAYCLEPRDFLISQLEEFKDWSGISSDDAPLRMEVEAFLTVSTEEQNRLVRQMQMAVDPEPRDPRSPW